jgi:hypothetical protein
MARIKEIVGARSLEFKKESKTNKETLFQSCFLDDPEFAERQALKAKKRRSLRLVFSST